MKVLLVDDILYNRVIIREIIKGFGYNYVEAENGLVALDYFSKHNFDMVLMDIEMPVMNGLETVIKMRTAFPEPKNQTKIYAITAYNPSMMDYSIDFKNFNGIITKPYSIEKIKALFI